MNVGYPHSRCPDATKQSAPPVKQAQALAILAGGQEGCSLEINKQSLVTPDIEKQAGERAAQLCSPTADQTCTFTLTKVMCLEVTTLVLPPATPGARCTSTCTVTLLCTPCEPRTCALTGNGVTLVDFFPVCATFTITVTGTCVTECELTSITCIGAAGCSLTGLTADGSPG